MHTSDKKTSRMDDGNAFIADPQSGPARAHDDLAEMVAEEFLRSATSGEDAAPESRDRVVTEELGGPFVPTNDMQEMADGVDAANPEDADVEPFPLAMGQS